MRAAIDPERNDEANVHQCCHKCSDVELLLCETKLKKFKISALFVFFPSVFCFDSEVEVKPFVDVDYYC